MTNVVITSAARTAVGSFLGSFSNIPAHDLGSAVLEEVVARSGIDKSEVSETIMGQVLSAGQGQNPARQAHIKAGFPVESSAWGINQVCGSGLRAVSIAAQHIQLGDATIVAAGGQEVWVKGRSGGDIQHAYFGGGVLEFKHPRGSPPRHACTREWAYRLSVGAPGCMAATLAHLNATTSGLGPAVATRSNAKSAKSGGA